MVVFFEFAFSRFYLWNTKIVGNTSYPVFASSVAVALFQVLNLKFLFDFLFYVILNRRDLVIKNGSVYGYVIVTLVLLSNLYFFQKRKNIKDILKWVGKLTKKQKRNRILQFAAYLVFSLTTTLYLAYLIRNNIMLF